METDEELLQVVYDSNKAGGAGVSIGRNIFQHSSPKTIVKAVSAIVHGNATVKQALEILRT